MGQSISNGQWNTILFGPFVIDLQTGELRKHGIRIRLQQKPLMVLRALLEKPGTVVTREELHNRLWASDTFVDFDHGLNVAISKLRTAFGESAEAPRYIETVGRLGYRFIGEIQNGHPAISQSAIRPNTPVQVATETAERPADLGLTTPLLKKNRATNLSSILAIVGVVLSGIAVTEYFKPSYVSKTQRPLLTVSAWLSPDPNSVVSGSLAIGPNGKRLAVIVEGRDGTNHLAVRSLIGFSTVELPHTEGAQYPFWSPDGNQIGFFADGRLKKISVDGGNATTIADAPDGRGGTWNRDGVILFAPNFSGALYRVKEDGTGLQRATRPKHETAMMSQRWPQFLPDDRHFIFYVEDYDATDPRGVWTGDVDSGETRFLFSNRSNARFASPDHLLYVVHGTLFARPFDANALNLHGEALAVALNVNEDVNRFAGSFAVSDSGLLIFQAATRQGPPFAGMWASSLVLFDGKGKPLRTLHSGILHDVRLSPDGKRAAVTIYDDNGSDQYVWVLDLQGNAEQARFGSLEGYAAGWSPDGKTLLLNTSDVTRVAFVDITKSPPSVRTLPLLSNKYFRCTDWSRDGEELLCNSLAEHWQIWTVPARSPEQGKRLFSGNANIYGGRFSPDNQYIAFVSDESGRPEIYVTLRSHPQIKTKVSISGGEQPVWSHDSRELYYVDGSQRIMKTEIRRSSAETVEASVPRVLFRIRTPDYAHNGPIVFDVTPEGQILATIKDREGGPLALLLNWQTAVEERQTISLPASARESIP